MVDAIKIHEYAREVVENFRPEKIILFGSYAYGKPTADSDIDLLVVMNHKGRAVEQAARIRKNPNYDAVCFHEQQCAEKYLKGRLIETGIEFPKTNDLVLLMDLALPVELLWEIYRDGLSFLSGFGFQFRYPGESADFSMAKKVQKSCRAFRLLARETMRL